MSDLPPAINRRRASCCSASSTSASSSRTSRCCASSRTAGAGCCSRSTSRWARTRAATSPAAPAGGASSCPASARARRSRARSAALAGAVVIALDLPGDLLPAARRAGDGGRGAGDRRPRAARRPLRVGAQASLRRQGLGLDYPRTRWHPRSPRQPALPVRLRVLLLRGDRPGAGRQGAPRWPSPHPIFTIVAFSSRSGSSSSSTSSGTSRSRSGSG